MTTVIRVLYVDDEPSLLEIGKQFLERSGDLSLVIIGSAPEAIDLLKKEQFDAIVSDYQMPGMDGIEFLKYVREHYGHIPFILFTGRGREEVVIQALDNGADFYLQKGGDPKSQFAELRNKIAKAVNENQAVTAHKDFEHRLLDIINFLPDATLAIDTHGMTIAWNYAMEQMTGVSAKEIIGKGNYEYALPFYHERRPMLLDLILNYDKTIADKYETVKHDGDKLISDKFIPVLYGGKGAYLWFVASPFFDANGNCAGAIESIRDITDQKKMELSLRASERRYHNVFESAGEAIIVVDRDSGIILDANTAAMRLYGYTRNEFRSLQSKDLSGDKRRMIQPDQEGILHIPMRQNQKKDGTLFPAEISGNIYPQKKRTIAIITVRDITKNKKAEQALMESEEKYRTIFDNAGDAIAIHDLEGNFIEVNEIICRRLGYSREELLKVKVSDTDDPDHARYVGERIRDLTKKGHIIFETIHITRDGRRIPTEVNAALFHIGKKPVVMSIARDVTDRKLAEEALSQANKKLTLLSTLTRHDIKNQLMVLQSYLTILEEKEPGLKSKEILQKVAIAAMRIASMIQFTKEYEKIGVNAPVWQECHTIIDTAAKEIPLGNVMVKNDIPAGAEVFADPLIVKVCYNLMDNAVRHGGTITSIRFSAEECGDDHVIICKDDGDGVVAEDKEKIFERGFGKNTGLGLALSREILDITGIIIRETGEPGKGARFEMTVPKGVWRIKGKED